MSPFSKITPIGKSEQKALCIALLVSLLFIALVSIVFSYSARKKKSPTINILTTDLSEPGPRPFNDPNDSFRVVPENFKHIDFKNRSYGVYTSSGTVLDLTLHDRYHRVADSSGWFRWEDVFYKDVTGDGRAEAIVRLTHVKCAAAGSCDGGADLFYIYEMRNGNLATLWQYETGSRAYGCSLKSLTVADKQLALELFGWCSRQGADDPGPEKFVVNGLTIALFEFDGWRFVKKNTELFATASSTDVKNYNPPIRLY